MISSTVAATVEKIIHANSSSANALTKNVLAAEAATKAGSIIVLVPLLFFWIPIVSSEAILLSIFDFQNLTYADWTNFLTHNVFYIITFILTLDLINWLISGYFYSYIVSAFHYLKLYGYYFLLLLVVGNIIYDGILDSSLSLNIYTMLVALVAGFYLKNNTHKMAFLFSFFISPRLLPEIYRWYLIHIV
jgi:TctA family transporter